MGSVKHIATTTVKVTTAEVFENLKVQFFTNIETDRISEDIPKALVID